MSIGNDNTITISNQAPIPADSQLAPLLDTTVWNDGGLWASAATAAAPGRSRGALAGARVMGTVTPTAQSLTLTFQGLINPSGTTSAAFATDANAPDSGTKVVASGATYVFDWLPRFPDYRIIMTSGGTKPTALSTTLTIVWDRSSGT